MAARRRRNYQSVEDIPSSMDGERQQPDSKQDVAQSMTAIQDEKDIPEARARLFATYKSGKTRDVNWRMQQLRQLYSMLDENEDRIVDAMCEDFATECRLEKRMSAIFGVKHDITSMLKMCKKWAKPASAGSRLFLFPGNATIRHEPHGVCLIMSPWNYPVNLALSPMCGAIACGNCVMLKVSRHAPNTSRVLCALITEYMDPDAFAVEGKGGASMIQAFLKEQWSHITFTGSPSVGKIVYKAAAEHFTPVLLELGGRNPVIVDGTVSARKAAHLLAWGKFFNAGQTCVAPNDVLCIGQDTHDALVEELKIAIQEMYGEHPEQDGDYVHVIRKRDVVRLRELCQLKEEEGQVVIGGDGDDGTRYFAPTILANVHPDALALKDEIFGPVLPLRVFNSVEEACEEALSRDIPLALYMITSSKQTQKYILDHTESGDVGINDMIVHIPHGNLPFGGKGASGVGMYHGKYSLHTYSHHRSVVNQWGSVNTHSLRFAPHTPRATGFWKTKFLPWLFSVLM